MYEMLKQAWGLTFPAEKFPLSRHDVYEVIPMHPTYGAEIGPNVGEESAVYIVSQHLADILIWLHDTYGGSHYPLPAEYDPDILGLDALSEAYAKAHGYGLYGTIADKLGRLLHDDAFRKGWLKSNLDVFSYIKGHIGDAVEAMWRASETPKWTPFDELDAEVRSELSRQCREKAATLTWPVGYFTSNQIPYDLSLLIGRECQARFGLNIFPSDDEIRQAAADVCQLRHDSNENFIILYGHIAELCDKLREMGAGRIHTGTGSEFR